jgi:Tol biopolymer transport system component
MRHLLITAAVMLGVMLAGCASVQGVAQRAVHPCPLATLIGSELSPDSTRVAYIFDPRNSTGTTQLRVIDVVTHEISILAENAAPISWSPDGRKLLITRGMFYFSVIDLDDSTVQLLPDFIGFPPPSWSPDGEYLTSATHIPDTVGWQLGIYDLRQESWIELLSSNIALGHAQWSPDGKRIAYTQENGTTTELMAFDIDSHESTLLFSGNYTSNSFLKWSHDGSRIAFFRTVSNAVYFTVIEADSSQDVVLDSQTDAYEGEFMWLTDNSGFISNKHPHGSGNDPVTVFRRNLDGEIDELLDLAGLTYYVEISPDATRIAYISDERGHDDLYVMNIDGTDKQRLTVNPGYSTCFDWPW